jgi:hypothetical protein
MKPVFACLVVLLSLAIADAGAQGASEMSFFVTSKGSGKGGDLGGIEGADRHCQSLAAAVGAGSRVWRAYLSTTGESRVRARERIGKGPWKNARGVVIAQDVEHLHGANTINRETALDEQGRTIAATAHDILTGATREGRAYLPDGRGDRTCNNWMSSGEGRAVVGHSDRVGLRDDEESRSWNSSHRTEGCSLTAMQRTGGQGLLYCFAAD